MGRHADSETLKARKRRELMDSLYTEALLLYQHEHSPDMTFLEGLCAICDKITLHYYERTGKQPPEALQKSTLQQYTKNGVPKSQSNSEQGYLTRGEAREIVGYCLEMADRGFPLTHQDLRIEVNSILRARLGDLFEGVGAQW
ncbi:hypothetical protein K435DRAFT_621759, partial [Dendrothele bispora CBS 962.96]